MRASASRIRSRRHRRAGSVVAARDPRPGGGRAAARAGRYREALELGATATRSSCSRMLTQAAFSLGLLQSETGDEAQRGGKLGDPRSSWGSSAGHRRRLGPAARWRHSTQATCMSRRGDGERAKRMFDAVVRDRRAVGHAARPWHSAPDVTRRWRRWRERATAARRARGRAAYARAQQFGRDSELPEGAPRGASGHARARRAPRAHRRPPRRGRAQYRDALALSARCEPSAAARFDAAREACASAAVARRAGRAREAA
mgnify:CR=1 FL=1